MTISVLPHLLSPPILNGELPGGREVIATLKHGTLLDSLHTPQGVTWLDTSKVKRFLKYFPHRACLRIQYYRVIK